MSVHRKIQNGTVAYANGEHKWTIEYYEEWETLKEKIRRGKHKIGDILRYEGPDYDNWKVKKGDIVKVVDPSSIGPPSGPNKLILEGINKGEGTSVRDKYFINTTDRERFDELEDRLTDVFGWKRLNIITMRGPGVCSGFGDNTIRPELLIYYDFEEKNKPDLKKWKEEIEKLSRERRIQEEKRTLESEMEEKVKDDDFSDDDFSDDEEEMEFNPFEYRGVTYSRDEEDNLYTEDGDYFGCIIIKKEEEREEEKKEDQLIGYSAF